MHSAIETIKSAIRSDLDTLGIPLEALEIDIDGNPDDANPEDIYMTINIGPNNILADDDLPFTLEGSFLEVAKSFYELVTMKVKGVIEEALKAEGFICSWVAAKNFHTLEVKDGEKVVSTFTDRIANIFPAVRDSFQLQISFT